jgi:asparagine synthase (glutamine-hydrolysing)
VCGIAGIVGDAARDRQVLERMGATLVHRGPDDHGTWTAADQPVGLVHRRLSIVDLSPAGHQPMLSSNGQLVITYNGEIYNHLEIRSELDALSLAPPGGWRGHSDTETLLEAVQNWGLEATLKRCVGMFAFGVWDRDRKTLSLVRDRFGEKPLYYGWVGRDFVFASELKAVRCHPRFNGEIDRRALDLFTRRNYIPAPLSIYRRLYKLEPGHILELTAEGACAPRDDPPQSGVEAGGVRLSAYWSYRDTILAGLANPISNEPQALEELDLALSNAIRGQSIADVPVGAFLSGGIDSSTVVALYQKYSATPVRTFTIGFNEPQYDESGDARAVARELRTDHNERIVTAREAQEVIPRLSEIYDEPFADSSQIPTHLVSAFAREQVTVALSGDGGDELFGGYNRYFATARLWSSARLVPWPVRAAAGASLGMVSPEAWNHVGRFLARDRLPRFFGAKVRKSLKTLSSARRFEQVFETFLDEWAEDGSPVLDRDREARFGALDMEVEPGAPHALRMMYCDSTSYLPDDILCKVDRAAMAVSLETRVPFLDHRVAAVAARIPLDLKIRGLTGKYLLRKLLYREAPSELFERPKAGFAVPVGEWIKGPLRGWAEDLLDPRRLREDGWFDADLVTRRWQAHLGGTCDATTAIWGILMFQMWQKDQAVAAAAAA